MTYGTVPKLQKNKQTLMIRFISFGDRAYFCWDVDMGCGYWDVDVFGVIMVKMSFLGVLIPKIL